MSQLPLKTADGRPLLHRYWRQEDGAAGLAVFFPGVHYGMQAPLLYYPNERLHAAGWDTLAVTYGFQSAMQPFSLERVPELMREGVLAVQVALAQRAYSRVGLVGKSLGTAVVAYLCGSMPQLAGARAAYLTPMLGSPAFDDAFRRTPQPAYVAIGSADRYYDPEGLQALQAERPFQLTTIEGVDHGMNHPDSLEASLNALRRVTEEVIAFIRVEQAAG